jgi:hypothetical protein
VAGRCCRPAAAAAPPLLPARQGRYRRAHAPPLRPRTPSPHHLPHLPQTQALPEGIAALSALYEETSAAADAIVCNNANVGNEYHQRARQIEDLGADLAAADESLGALQAGIEVCVGWWWWWCVGWEMLAWGGSAGGWPGAGCGSQWARAWGCVLPAG